MQKSNLVNVLLADTHKTIDQYSEESAESIGSGSFDPVYPPGVSVSPEHLNALASINLNKAQLEAVKILLKDLCANTVFDLLSKIDGVADPVGYESESIWLGLCLKEKQEGQDEELLHNMFMDTY